LEKAIYSRRYNAFRKLLRESRHAANITQVELSARLGISQAAVSKIEMGERRLDVVELRAWCKALGVTMKSFVARLENPEADRGRGGKRSQSRSFRSARRIG